MRKLILVKHAKPLVDERVPATQWPLSEQGRADCQTLAELLKAHDPAVIVTSDEAKAIETGKLVSRQLGKPMETAPGLHEHDRSNVPMMRSRDFISSMAMFFKQSDRVVLGRESAKEALRRFESAVESILSAYGEGNVALITHGTVIALFSAKRGGGDAFLLFRRLGLPSLVTFSLPELKLLEVIERIEREAQGDGDFSAERQC